MPVQTVSDQLRNLVEKDHRAHTVAAARKEGQKRMPMQTVAEEIAAFIKIRLEEDLANCTPEQQGRFHVIWPAGVPDDEYVLRDAWGLIKRTLVANEEIAKAATIDRTKWPIEQEDRYLSPLMVLTSGAGFFLGRMEKTKKNGFEDIASRETDYYDDEQEAEEALRTGTFTVRHCSENEWAYQNGRLPDPKAPPAVGVLGDECRAGNECGRTGCPNCQD